MGDYHNPFFNFGLQPKERATTKKPCTRLLSARLFILKVCHSHYLRTGNLGES